MSEQEPTQKQDVQAFLTNVYTIAVALRFIAWMSFGCCIALTLIAAVVLTVPSWIEHAVTELRNKP